MEEKQITFTSNPEYYEIGDTISIGLDNGKTAVYTLTEIHDSAN